MNLDQRLHDPALESYGGRNNKITTRPGSGFSDLGITPNLLKRVSRLNFKNPTPVQMQAIPIGLRGEDILATAQTGSGKTLAFGIPMLQRLAEMKRGVGLIVVPTRELAIQVDESLQSISHSIHIRSTVVIGGASILNQRNALKKNPRIIVATPGRLIDLMDRKYVNLANIEILVLDEADRMLDMGFAPDIKKIMKTIPQGRQTMLFSATMPKEIEVIAEKMMSNPTRIEIDRAGVTPAEVSHEMFFIPNQEKSRLLAVRLKQCSGPVLVFTRTKRMATKLTEKVNKMGFHAAEIHSNRSLGQRRQALEGFKRGKYQILVATDIAARGIDVTGIELVVNYDMPANSEDYVHRIGRTGRAGKTGHAISFATNEQRSSIRSIERFMKTKLAVSVIPTLPSERYFMDEAERTGLKTKPVGDAPPQAPRHSRRKFGQGHSPKRHDFNKQGPRKFATKRKGPKSNNFKSKKSTRQNVSSGSSDRSAEN